MRHSRGTTGRGERYLCIGALACLRSPLRALDPGSDVLAETRVWHESSDAFWGVLGSPATSITSTRVALIPGGGGSNDIARRFLRGLPPESPLQYGRPRHTQPRLPPIQHPVGNRSRRDPLPRWRTERVRYMPSSRCLIRVIPQLRHALTLRLCDLPHHDHGDLPLIARYSFDQKGVCDTSKRAGRRCADTVQTEDPKLGREAARQDAPWVVDPHSY